MKILGRILKGILFAVLAVVLVAALGIGILTAMEYRPQAVEEIQVERASALGIGVPTGTPLKIMTWNVGYGALGDNANFFMDGGELVNTATKDRLDQNLEYIRDRISDQGPDFLFLQEIDRDSTRSHHVDEVPYLQEHLHGYDASFANNFRVAFVPYPIPPIGKVDSGIAVFSRYEITGAQRYNLPCPFQWPVRVANLKRCLNIVRIPVQGDAKTAEQETAPEQQSTSGPELVLINLHLEAFDDGEGKIAQARELWKVLEAEREAGNYVIAGGDFNQVFSSSDVSRYAVLEDTWQPGAMDVTEVEARGWKCMADPAVATCRSLDRSLDTAEQKDPQHFQYYVIDGFIVSDNIETGYISTLDYGFKATDHNPVIMGFELK